MAETVKPKIQNENSYQKFLDKLNELKREAYAYVNQALDLDSSKKYNEAIVIYHKCVQSLTKAINYVKNENIDLVKAIEANKIYQDLNVMLKKTIDRLELLEKKKNNNNNNEIINNDDYLLIGDEILNDDKNASIIECVDNNEANATLIYNIDSGVQLFYIKNDGSVSTPSYPTSLSLYMFNDTQYSVAKGFIKVDHWIYPLSPDKTPAMKTNYNGYIFPNSKNDEKNSQINFEFVGIMFNETVNNETRLLFEDLLNNLSVLMHQEEHKQPLNQQAEAKTGSKIINEQNKDVIIIDDDDEKDIENNKEKESTAEYISRNLINGAKLITKGVSTTTEYANKYLNIGGEKLKSQLTPNENPSKVDPTFKKCAEGVRYGTNVTVRVSSFLVDKLGLLANKTAKTVAPYIKSGSTKLLTQTGIVKSNDNANQYFENVCTVASSSVVGFSIVYESLENAAKSLAKSITKQSVQVVTHKYGNDAGLVTENVLYSAGNVAVSANNLRNLKITKTIAKATAKETLNTFSNNKIENNNENIKKDEKNIVNEIKKL